MRSRLEQILADHRRVFQDTFQGENLNVLEGIAQAIRSVLEGGHTLFLCGNGGSAADCQHIAAEFIGRFKVERESWRAIALTTDTSVLTALANDYSYDVIFARQLEGLAKPGDLLIALSTSGNSRNVILAVERAKEMGLKTVGLTGSPGGHLADAADIVFKVPSQVTSHIQEMHITALHGVSEVVEEALCTPKLHPSAS